MMLGIWAAQVGRLASVCGGKLLERREGGTRSMGEFEARERGSAGRWRLSAAHGGEALEWRGNKGIGEKSSAVNEKRFEMRSEVSSGRNLPGG